MARVTADPLGVWVLKWIGAPLFIVFVLGIGFSSWQNVRACRKLAEEHGYLESSYSPGSRGSASECICRKKQNPDGTIDEQASMSFRMNQ